MKRDFISFNRIEGSQNTKTTEKSMVSRLEHLLHLFQLENRFFESLNWNNLTHTDFSQVNSILQQEREKAVQFLKSALERDHEI